MLLNLSADKYESMIVDNWDAFYNCIAISLPKDEEVSKNELLHKVLMDIITLWIVYKIDSKTNRRIVTAVFTTSIINDTFTFNNSLLIYTMYNIKGENHNLDVWKDEFKLLRSYAITKKCNCIVGYTDNEYLVNRAKQFGCSIKEYVKLRL